MEVKIANEIRRLTAGAEAMSEQFLVVLFFDRPLNYFYEWT